MNITRVGIDLAKLSFSVHAVDEKGNVVLRKALTRAKLMEWAVKLPRCLIGIEACAGAHDMARCLQAFGHDVRLMGAKFVIPYRTNQKNDGNDAEAICEAVGRPKTRFVPIKSVEQQAILTVHRIRQELVESRTAHINQLRGLLAEFGVLIPKGRFEVRRNVAEALADPRVPILAREVLTELYERIRRIEAEVLSYERRIKAMVRDSEAMQRLTALPGVGQTTASAMLASIGDAKLFSDGRQLAAWLGLVPRQFSTGGKPRLGKITKAGSVYLRTLLIHGARSVLSRSQGKTDAFSLWVQALAARRGFKRACVAVAAKNARLIWVLLAKNETYRPAHAAA
jgi:transposase